MGPEVDKVTFKITMGISYIYIYNLKRRNIPEQEHIAIKDYIQDMVQISPLLLELKCCIDSNRSDHLAGYYGSIKGQTVAAIVIERSQATG